MEQTPRHVCVVNRYQIGTRAQLHNFLLAQLYLLPAFGEGASLSLDYKEPETLYSSLPELIAAMISWPPSRTEVTELMQTEVADTKQLPLLMRRLTAYPVM